MRFEALWTIPAEYSLDLRDGLVADAGAALREAIGFKLPVFVAVPAESQAIVRPLALETKLL